MCCDLLRVVLSMPAVAPYPAWGTSAPGADQTANAGGAVDALITKLHSSGSSLVYSTYLGGAGNDHGYGIAVDASGNAYLTGFTGSSNFPITSGAYQTTYGGGGSQDAFVTKLNAAGSSLLSSTYLGGTGSDLGYGIAVDASGNAYVTGQTECTHFPTTVGAYQAANAGVSDAFVTKFLF